MVGYLSLFPRLSIKKNNNKAQKKVDGLSIPVLIYLFLTIFTNITFK